MAGTIAPVIEHQFFDDNGDPASGYLLFSWEAGSTTPIFCYTDAALQVPHTNPIVLDAAGRATIFLSAASYKFSLATPTDTTPTSPLWTVDNVQSIQSLAGDLNVTGEAGENINAGEAVYISSGAGGKTVGLWYLADASYTYSSTSAALVGMAPNAISSGNTGTIQLSGRVAGLSALTTGSTYYIDTTPGAITATAPANSRQIGFADSTTSLIISTVGTTTATSSGGTSLNLCADAKMLIWAAGDAAAPTHYALGGVTPTVVRCGAGLADTNSKYGPWCIKITGAAGGTGSVTQTLLSAAAFDTYWQGQVFGHGAWVKCSTGGSSRVTIYDGVGTSSSTDHTGDGTWQWLSVSRTLDAAADRIVVATEVDANIAGYTIGFTTFEGSIPSSPAPSQATYGTLVFTQIGTLTVVPQFAVFFPARPMLVKDVMLRVKTAPTGQALKCDALAWDGGAWQSMFGTLPEVAAAAFVGQAQPDGTYRYRCLGEGMAASFANGELSVSITQVGSGVAGADLTMMVRCLQFIRPLEDQLEYNG